MRLETIIDLSRQFGKYPFGTDILFRETASSRGLLTDFDSLTSQQLCELVLLTHFIIDQQIDLHSECEYKVKEINIRAALTVARRHHAS